MTYFLKLFFHSVTFILIIFLLYRRKFCDGHIILVFLWPFVHKNVSHRKLHVQKWYFVKKGIQLLLHHGISLEMLEINFLLSFFYYTKMNCTLRCVIQFEDKSTRLRRSNPIFCLLLYITIGLLFDGFQQIKKYQWL